MNFNLKSPFQPTGDQPHAIQELTRGVANGAPHQTLLGVTGSGKTFTIANLIQQTQLPTLIVSHNKTLAGQLYQEFRDFFPDNAVSYFVSYYDYYQPEAYIPSTDTYIEKDADINEEIDKLRLSSTTNLLTRPDVIVIASVSCIYNLGSPVEYGKYILEIAQGQIVARDSIFKRLIDLQYERSNTDLHRGSFRIRGDTVQLWPAYVDYALKLVMLDNLIEKITPIDPLTGDGLSKAKIQELQLGTRNQYVIYPAKHYLTDPSTQEENIALIRQDLKQRVKQYQDQGKIVEAHRIEQKVNYDLDMIKEFGFVKGIENYSRYFDGRKPGEPPFTLLDYFHHNAKEFHQGKFLTVIDESHITNSQVRGMYFGDQSRKKTLIDFGFRLPAAIDNRPLTQDEFLRQIPQAIHVSATPNDFEISLSQKALSDIGKPIDDHPRPKDEGYGNVPGIVEQLIRPTGLIDPEIEIRPIEGQVTDLVLEVIKRVKQGQRVLVTTLTKRMSEDLTDFLNDEKKVTALFEGTSQMITLPKVAYLHSDIVTLDRADILDDLRRGEYDVLVGINLLREGLDLPEVSLVAILDADKEGFLRSATSLIQTMGRAARHQDGRVIMYADKTTKSMQAAIDETTRRRNIQLEYNKKHGITPISINKPIRDVMIEREKKEERGKGPKQTFVQLSKHESVDLKDLEPEGLTPTDKKKWIKTLTRKMNQAARELDFELAAMLRDKTSELEAN